MATRSPGNKFRGHLKTLDRRHNWLTQRIAAYHGADPAHDLAERSALAFALGFLRDHEPAALAALGQPATPDGGSPVPTNRALVALRDWAAKKSTTDEDLAARPLWSQIASEVDTYLAGPDPIPTGPSLFETTEVTP